MNTRVLPLQYQTCWLIHVSCMEHYLMHLWTDFSGNMKNISISTLHNTEIQCGTIITRSVFFLKSSHRHPISRPWGRNMGCLLWIQISIHGQLLDFCMAYTVVWDRYITALDCIKGLFIVHHQYPGCWWPGDAGTQDNLSHYSDVIMGAMAFQITCVTIDYSTVYSGANQRKHQSSPLLAFVRGIHRWPVNSPHKWPAIQ